MTEELSPWQQYKKNLGTARPWDFLKANTVYVEDQEANERMTICLTCPELAKKTKVCKKCGCFMAAKTKLEDAKCPLGKW
jgi:hypothetical protein